MVVVREDGSTPVLSEVPADDEAQLQELIKDNPDLLPVDEFGMSGPLLVVGRETTLPSGGVDLVALARSGEVLVVEFKTGPQNADFRHVLAQLLDYGSDLWRLSFEEFESIVPSRFFAGARCRDARVRGKTSLMDAARSFWPDLTDEEAAILRDQVERQLAAGGFHYVVVAQRFTPTIERTVEYLNATMQGARFYAVELVKFASGALSAFESRTVMAPSRTKGGSGSPASTDETRLLQEMEGETYRDVLRELIEACRGLGLRFDWGKVGPSIRIPTADRRTPLTIGWLFPSGGRGWMGLSDLTLGFDEKSAATAPSLKGALDAYIDEVAGIPGARLVAVRNLRAYHFIPQDVIEHRSRIIDAIARFIGLANAAPPVAGELREAEGPRP
jgi:hypothetical protein